MGQFHAQALILQSDLHRERPLNPHGCNGRIRVLLRLVLKHYFEYYDLRFEYSLLIPIQQLQLACKLQLEFIAFLKVN